MRELGCRRRSGGLCWASREEEQGLCTTVSAASSPREPNHHLLNNSRFYSLTVTLDNGVYELREGQIFLLGSGFEKVAPL